MPAHELPKPTIADIHTFADLDLSLDQKGTAQPGYGLYPRDGDPEVTELEDLLARVTYPGQEHNVILASGMSAVRESVNFALDYVVTRGTRNGGAPRVAASLSLYSQSGVYFDKEGRKGVDVVRFGSGDPGGVRKVSQDRGTPASTVKLSDPGNSVGIVESVGADVIFAETVANTPEMPVLDVYALLKTVRGLEQRKPIVILDNTLPLSTGLDLGQMLLPSDPVIVVESGTKNLMNNSGLLGIAWSPNLKLVEGLRKQRAHSGAVLSNGAPRVVREALRRTLPAFHERNRAVFRSTAAIAMALREARQELGKDSDFDLAFPLFPEHDNYQLGQQLTPEGVPFISPVVFVTPTSEWDARPLLRRIGEHPAVQEQIRANQIHFGQSFGGEKARLLYDRNMPNLRVAGGYNIEDPAALVAAIKTAALAIK